MRTCKTCLEEKEDTEFYGGRNHCKKCNRKKYYDKLKEGHYDNDDSIKICNKCNLLKNSSEFRTHKKYCKKCENKQTYDGRKETQSLNNKEYLKKYQKENKDKINYRMRIYKTNRKKIDPLYKLSIVMGRIVRDGLSRRNSKKTMRTIEYVGLSPKDLALYLESKFESWMTWENYGLYNGEINYGWDIDHIIPLSSAETEDELVKLNHYTNLQPLCSYINRYIKKDNI